MEILKLINEYIVSDKFRPISCRDAGQPETPKTRPFYGGTSLIRNRHPIKPYSRTTPRLLWRS